MPAPLDRSTTWPFQDGSPAEFSYARDAHPTGVEAEHALGELDGGRALLFPSGMGAVTNVLLTMLRPGATVAVAEGSYYGTSLLCRRLAQWGVRLLEFDQTAAPPPDADLIWLESPSNPLLIVCDLPAICAAPRKAGSIVAVDNTFATPINQAPLQLGADVVVHSASKFLGGHADVLGGALCGNAAIVQQVFAFREITGAALDPHAAYLLLRGMKTLALRVRHQNESAMTIARFLSMHPRVERVFYPGLESHKHHDVAHKQMRGYGGMLSFALTGGWDAAKACLAKLKYAHRAANLGAVETIAGVPATTSHVEVSPEGRAQLGIPEGLVRYSVGIEDTGDLIDDLTQALG